MKTMLYLTKVATSMMTMLASAIVLLFVMYNVFTGFGMNWLALFLGCLFFYLGSDRYEELCGKYNEVF